MQAYDAETMDALQRFAAPRPVMGVPAVMTPTTAAASPLTAAQRRAELMAGEPDERAYNPSNNISRASTARVQAEKAQAEANADMARVAAIDGVPWQAKIQYIYGKYGESSASNFVRNGGMAPAKDFVGPAVTNEFSNWLAGLQSQNAHANDSMFDQFGSKLSQLAHDPGTLLAAATTGQTGGMTGAQALTGGDVGAGLKTDLAALGSAAAGAGASNLGASTAVSGGAAGATGSAINSGGDTSAILKGAALGAAGATLYSGLTDTTGGTTPTTGSEPVQTAALDTGITTDVTAPTTGTMMPAAVPESDPTFGGALTQTAPGAFTSTPTTATLSSPSMPAAVPESDPTFGGSLTNTAPGVFSSPLSTGSVAPATVTGNDTTSTDTSTTGGVGADGSADMNTGGSNSGSATQSTGGLTGTTGTSSDTGTAGTGDATLDSTGFAGPTATTGTDTGGNGTGTGTDPTLDATGFQGPTGTGGDTTGTTSGTGAFDVAGARSDPSSPDSGGTIFDSGSTLNFSGSGGTGGGGSGLGSDFVDNSETGAFDQGGSRGVFDDHGNPMYESPGGGMDLKGLGDVITKYGPLTLGVAGIVNQRSAAKDAAAKIGQVGSQQREIAGDLLAKYKSGELNAADKLAIDEWQRGAIAQVRQYYANAHQSDSSAAVDAEARVNARAEAMKEAARQGLLKMGLDALNVTDRYQAAAANAEYGADQQMLANAINFMNAYGSWLRGAPKSSTAAKRGSQDVSAATGEVSGPDFSIPDYGQSSSDYNVPA